MTEALPAPPVPADADLRGMHFMALDVVRLLDSDLFALSTGDEFKAAVALWCKAWLQIPAGSLPQDDRVLAHLSGAGARWKKIKPMALKGWAPHSDGRLYHKVVTEKAVEAWEDRKEYREVKGNEVERQRRHRQYRKQLFASLRKAGMDAAFDTPTTELKAMMKRAGLPLPVTDEVTPVTTPVTNGHGDSHVSGHAPATAMQRLREGEGEGQGNISDKAQEPKPPTTPPAREPPPGTKTLAQALGTPKPQRERSKAEIRDIWQQNCLAWLKDHEPPSEFERIVKTLMDDPEDRWAKRKLEEADRELKADKVVRDHGGTPERTVFGVAAVRNN